MSDWGFTSTADSLPRLIITLRNRPDGVDRITWQLRVGAYPGSFRYKQISVEDATQDMADAEQQIHNTRMNLIRSIISGDNR